MTNLGIKEYSVTLSVSQVKREDMKAEGRCAGKDIVGEND